VVLARVADDIEHAREKLGQAEFTQRWSAGHDLTAKASVDRARALCGP